MVRKLFAPLVVSLLAVASHALAEIPRAPGDPDIDRVLAGRLEAIAQLSPEDLKRLYLHCSAAAEHGRLGSGEIAMCSVAYEALLGDTFGGDFRQLLEWSRGQKSVLLKDGAKLGKDS